MSHFKRLNKEISNYLRNYPSESKEGSESHLIKMEDGLYLLINMKNVSHFKGLVFGPKDTSYQDGFYVFDFVVSDTYPFNPPVVKHLTTDGRIRFNPNLYEGGKVCLSILGTWAGPPWCSTMTIETILQYLRMIMNEDPLRNEPGYSNPLTSNLQAKDYNEYVLHENIRYAIIEVKQKKIFPEFQSVIDYHYESIKDSLIIKVTKLVSKPSSIITIPYSHKLETNYNSILEKLLE